MKKYQLLVLITCIALLSMSVTLLSYSFYKIKHIELIPMDVKIDKIVGINLDADALHFGRLMKGGCGTRGITLKHEYSYPLKVMINVIGELESWTSIKENGFILNKNEEEEVEFKVCSPVDAIEGKTYTGTARIVLKRV